MRQGKQQAGRSINPAYGLGVNPAAADTVRRIFTEFTHPDRRATLREIAAGLNVDQVVTARGGQWHASTVRYVLRNGAYAGLMQWAGVESKHGKVPAIVTPDDYEEAQQLLAQLRRGNPGKISE